MDLHGLKHRSKNLEDESSQINNNFQDGEFQLPANNNPVSPRQRGAGGATAGRLAQLLVDALAGKVQQAARLAGSYRRWEIGGTN